MSLCQEDCDLVDYNKEENIVKCSCELSFGVPFISQINIDKNKLYKFMNINTVANFVVMKCYRLFFSIKGIKRNIGFYSFIPIFAMYFICIFIFYLYDYKNLKEKINEIVFAKRNYQYNINI